jgi:HEAT repeat protein
MRPWRILLVAFAVTAAAQTPKEIRATVKQGASALPKLRSYLKNPDDKVRDEAVKGIVEIGTAGSVDLLIEAAHDNSENIQIRATDGLVNFYLPGYVPSGMTAPIKRAGSSIKARFGDRNDQTIEPYVKVRPDVIQAVGVLVRGGAGSDSRANAARAIGILRGREAEPDLYAALKSKDSEVLFETVVALQKIRDEEAGPHVQYLLRDLNERVQIAAIETSGILRNRAALPDLRSVLQTTNKMKVRRAALTAIAMLPDPANRATYTQYLSDGDDTLRAAAGEGLGRLGDKNDLTILEKAWREETKRTAQISFAFALVMDGETQYNENSPLRFLVQSLDLGTGRGLAAPLLTEAARNGEVRLQLYGPLELGTKEQKIAIAQILSVDGDRETEPHLEKTSHDPDPQVAEGGLRALRNLRARL